MSFVSLCLIAFNFFNINVMDSAPELGAQFAFESGELGFALDENMHIRLEYKSTECDPIMDGYQASDFLVFKGQQVDQFKVYSTTEVKINDKVGKGIQYTVKGKNEKEKIEKITKYTTYESFPELVLSHTTFVNYGEDSKIIDRWVTNNVAFKNTEKEPSYYAFQGSSTSARQDWIREVNEFYYDKNFMGMNNSDYGGGVPVVDLWRPDMGIAIGHTELVPKEINLPTSLEGSKMDATIQIMHEYGYPSWMNPGDTISTLNSFYLTHQGDYYAGLSKYSEFMQAKGIEMVPAEEEAFEPIWCAWGYERTFTKNELIGTLDKVKELGIKWAVVDDGFQIAEGEWELSPDRFPGGDAEMKEIVDEIHKRGLKAKIWWTPLAADPGSRVLREHPEAILYTEEWIPQIISWWNAYYLSPVNDDAIDHTKETIKLFLDTWGFDGFKMDGQHMNAVPQDHNPAANLDSPLESVEKLPDFFRMIYDEARAIKPNAVIENCPCGTCMSYYNMASTNQTVSSDPLSSWQIRHKGKTYKALVPHTAYYGDHVELSDDASDFASSMGIGAVLGTKFTYPANNPNASGDFLLTPEKEVEWKKWFSLYNEHMISKEKYLGDLYDIGYDKPETHVIQKDQDMFFAFYADSWAGDINFKGLDPSKSYQIYDYVNGKDLGVIAAGKQMKNLSFKKHLLVVLRPI
ncbi:glycoside hydrolase family 36 protein [Portibacter lacus]|uniref:Alpha-galactosidase n=1 Tax=Portibacter lacus TaxID=1099794 RepID=A0AA37SPC9_9BACT|nr:glycoside hydrolase family 36 protein [Portibacter lacus]GLR17582.1 alpha-galactosidase [Portibacter lacus]